MPGLYRDEGVVLRTIKLGEADRIVTIFTQGHGKVRAVAKGVRRTQSKFGSRLEPTSHVALQLYAGRDLDVVTQCETVESNHAIRERYGLLTHAVPMLEAVDHLTEEREANPAIYRMLTGALRTLAELRNPIVTPAFFWKLLALEGYQPRLDGCSALRRAAATRVVRPRGGRRALRTLAIGGGRRLSPEAFALLGRILGGGLQAVLADEPGPATHDVERLGLMAIEHFLERRLKSAVLL